MTSNDPATCRPSIAVVLGRSIQQVVFALWWGGLTFYATVVIHVGTHALGSERQGFITQRVTYFLNGLGTLVAVLMWVQIRRSRQLVPWVLWGLLVLSQVGLFVDHYRLTGMLDFETETVPSPEVFYREHAVYLWLTAVQWGAGLGWMLWATFQGAKRASRDEVA